MKSLFIYVKKHVPYYREVFAHIEVSDIRSIEDWEKLPVLTKEIIRERFDDLRAESVSSSDCRSVATGGSSGVPLKLCHDKRFPMSAVSNRVMRWWGCSLSPDLAFIYRKVRTGVRATLNGLLWWPTRRIFLDASLLSPESMDAFFLQLIRVKPEVIQGYVGAVFEFAKYCEGRHIDFSYLNAIWVTSAPLTESQRMYMERVFGVPVYDQYGCSEIFWLAAECRKKQGLHVMSDLRKVEIVDEESEGVPKGVYGNILVTDYENKVFPLIRYQNGDRGRYLGGDCSCGLPFPLLDKVKGRESECLRLEDGRVIAGEFLTTIFDDCPEAVEAFQVHQKSDYSIELLCVVADQVTGLDICKRKRAELEKLVERAVNVKLSIVEKIKHDQGKIRYIVSEVI